MPMTHRERIEAAIRGEKPDRVPIALWRHFPVEDQTAEGLAQATIAFQKKYEFDLVKVTPASGYPAEAWGAELQPTNNAEGTRKYLHRPVQNPEDWHELKTLDATQGVFERELRALELIRQGMGHNIHVLQTIFSPLTIAKQLSGDLVLEHLRRHPSDLKAGLRTITQTTARFALACLEHGADGIFFATQLARHDLLLHEEYREFGVEYDLPILDSVRDRTKITVLHLHGINPMFDLTSVYPVQIVNWHDRETHPSLAEGQRLFGKGALLGGLHRSSTLPHGTPSQVQAQARDALQQAGNSRIILGAGCVTLLTTPEANIQAVKAAV
jgi:uroporphyrinogen decarboxylase